MDKGYWTDDVAALALVTPVDEIRVDELSADQLRRLVVMLDEIRREQPDAGPEFELRYRQIQRLLDAAEPD
ncbi:hypothetical protein [Herbiconiux sp. UC225_62]|uniref:hypothetical protein n=1 Tax=Herbiconiux sp. UC225_62 TaxID=3350168 RepID=UPI0036D3DEEF